MIAWIVFVGVALLFSDRPRVAKGLFAVYAAYTALCFAAIAQVIA